MNEIRKYRNGIKEDQLIEFCSKFESVRTFKGISLYLKTCQTFVNFILLTWPNNVSFIHSLDSSFVRSFIYMHAFISFAEIDKNFFVILLTVHVSAQRFRFIMILSRSSRLIIVRSLLWHFLVVFQFEYLQIVFFIFMIFRSLALKFVCIYSNVAFMSLCLHRWCLRVFMN